MTITASIHAPTSTPAASDAACARPSADGAVDSTGAPDGGVSGFGDVLKKNIAERPAADEPAEDPAARVSQAPAAAATKSADSKGDATKADARKDGDHDTEFNGGDLAAQLALVSQWTQAAVPVPTVRGDAPSDAPDVKDQLDAARATVARFGTTNDLVEQAADADPLSRGDLLLNQRVTASGDRALRSTAALASLAAVNGIPIDAKGLETARAVAAIGASSSLDPLTSGTNHGATTDGSFAGALLTQVASQLASATARATSITGGPTAADALHEQVGTSAWSREVGQAALRLAANDLQNVSLHLNPEHLGPLEVQLRLANGIAHLQFSAAHADTRQALESSRPTLDQMFGEQGLKLGDWSVGQQSSHASFARNFGAAQSQNAGGDTSADDGNDTAASVTIRATRPLGLVDTFA